MLMSMIILLKGDDYGNSSDAVGPSRKHATEQCIETPQEVNL